MQNKRDPKKVCAAILAGGKSRRFGRDKTLLEVDGLRLVEKIARDCKSVFGEVIILSNSPGKFNIEGTSEVEDIFKDKGPIGGLHAALSKTELEGVFLTACDMPNFSIDLARRVTEESAGFDACLPEHGGKMEPAFAFYSKSLLQRVDDIIMNNEGGSLRSLLNSGKYNVLSITNELAETAFLNINRPEDLAGIKNREDNNG